MLAHTVLFTEHYGQYVNKEVVYSRHYMLDFLLFMSVLSVEYDLSTKYIYHTFYVGSYFVLYKIFCRYRNIEEIYSRHYMLDFTIFMAVPSGDYFSITNDI